MDYQVKVLNINDLSSDHSFDYLQYNSSDINSNTNLNSTSTEWTNKQVASFLILGLITAITIIANSFVLFIFLRAGRGLRNPTNLLLCNLAFSDLLVGLLVMPMLTTTTVLTGNKWIYGDIVCEAFDYIHFFCCALSMWSMIAVAVDRFIGVSNPLKYKNIMTRNKTCILILITWVLALSLTAGPLTGWPKQMSGVREICFVNLERPFLIFIAFAGYWIPITCTIIMYCLVYRKAVEPFLQKTENEKQFLEKKGKQIRLAKNIATVTGALFIFYAPVFLMFTIKAIELPYFSVEILMLTAWLRYSCSTVNPFMYALAVPSYRKEIMETLFANKRNRGRLDQSSTKSFDTQTEVKVEENVDGRSKWHCTHCGVVMPDFVPLSNVTCNKCHKQVIKAEWKLPDSWEKTGYFLCTECPTLRYFDGNGPCFCQSCGHKFAPPGLKKPQLPPQPPRRPEIQVMVTPPEKKQTNSAHAPAPDVLRRQKEVEVIRKLRNSVLILEQNKKDSVSLDELERIVDQLQKNFDIDLDSL